MTLDPYGGLSTVDRLYPSRYGAREPSYVDQLYPTRAPRRSARPRLDSVAQAERDSLLERAANIGVGGLELAGGLLDTAGSSTRALLAGRPDLAFSGATSWDDRISGRDLLEEWGLLDKNKAGFGGSGGWSDIDWGDAAGDIAGFATEVATDPLTYLGIGGLTRAGQAAKFAGTGTRGLVPAIKQGERSLLSVGLPFTNAGLDFTGPAAARTAEAIGAVAGAPVKAADRALGSLGYDAPVSRGLNWGRRVYDAAMDPDVMGKVAAPEQEMARKLSDARRANEFEIRNAPRQSGQVFMQGLEKVKAAAPALAQGWGDADYEMFGTMVRLASARGVDAAESVLADGIGMPPEAKLALQETVDSLRKMRDTPYHRALNAGGSGELMEGVDPGTSEHFPRSVDLDKLTGKEPAKDGQPGFGSRFAKHRVPAIANVPEVFINEMTDDATMRKQGAASRILGKYAEWLDPKFGERPSVVGGQPVVVPGSKEKHAQAIADWLQNVPVGELFNRHAIQDQALYLKSMNLRASHIEAAQQFIAHSVGDEGTISLAKFYENTPGFDLDRSIKYMAGLLGMDPRDVAKLRITEETANIVDGSLKPMIKNTGVMEEVGKVYDKWLNAIKFYQTIPFPKFHATNAFGGHYLNIASGLMKTPADVAEYGRAVLDTMAGRLDDETLEEIASFDVLGGSVTAGLDDRVVNDLTNAGIIDSRASHGVDLRRHMTPEELAARPLPKKAFDASTGWYLNTMSNIGGGIERSNRAPLYVYLKRKAAKEGKGFSPVEAAREVGKRQIDYGRNTPFERGVAKRLVPYWSWIRGSTELVLENILQSPGGPMAQTVRATNVLRDDSEGLPKYLEERTAIPVPGSDSRFLTGLGLPTDDVFSRFSFGADAGGTIQRGVENTVGMLTPAVTIPYTLASGRQPFFGRETEDLYQYPTSDSTANTLLGVVPGSRAISTFRQLNDERKPGWARAANLVSPATITDVSGGVEYQKAREQYDAVTEMLKASPSTSRYETYYIPKDQKAAGGEQVDEARQLLDLQNMLRKRMFATREE